MRERFASTVFTVTTSSAATSLFERPSATSAATRCSVGVSCPDAGARPPMRASSARAFSAQRAAPSSSKSASAASSESRAACFCRPRRRTVPLASKVRPRSNGRHPLVLLERVLERRKRGVVIACGGREQTSAPTGGGEHPRAAEPPALGLEGIQSRPRSFELAAGDQELDPVREERVPSRLFEAPLLIEARGTAEVVLGGSEIVAGELEEAEVGVAEARDPERSAPLGELERPAAVPSRVLHLPLMRLDPALVVERLRLDQPAATLERELERLVGVRRGALPVSC